MKYLYELEELFVQIIGSSFQWKEAFRLFYELGKMQNIEINLAVVLNVVICGAEI